MQTLENLEQRLAILEETLLPLPSRGISEDLAPPLLEKLEKISVSLKNPRNSWVSLEEKLRLFKEISRKFEENPTYFLGNSEKLRLMWFSLNLLENIQEDFKDLRKLSNFLEFDPFLELREKNLRIEPIVHENLLIYKSFKEISGETRDFLANYQDILAQLNKKMLYFDAMLAVFEEKPAKN